MRSALLLIAVVGSAGCAHRPPPLFPVLTEEQELREWIPGDDRHSALLRQGMLVAGDPAKLQRLEEEYRACNRREVAAAPPEESPEVVADRALKACFGIVEPFVRSSALALAAIGGEAPSEELEPMMQWMVDEEKAEHRALLMKHVAEARAAPEGRD